MPPFKKRSIIAAAVAAALAIGSMSASSQTQEQVLRNLADAGDLSARMQLAKLYLGEGAISKAVIELEVASSSRVPDSDRLLAEVHAGQSGEDEWARAMHYAQLAFAAGAGGDLGLRLGTIASLRSQDANLSIEQRRAYGGDAEQLLGRAVIDGNAEAKWRLGYLLTFGPGPNLQPDKGYPLILAAADAGNVVASRWVSQLYGRIAETGRVPAGLILPAVDVRAYAQQQSMIYLKQAAAAGNPMAMKELAQRFEVGEGGGEGISTATRAARLLSYLDSKGESSPKASDINLPSPGDGASCHDATATVELRTQLEQARKEIQRLQALLTKDESNAADLNRRGLAYFIAGDYEAALPLFRRASELNHAGAMANLAIHYLNGYAIPQDVRQAVALLTRSAELGNVIAAENLAELNERGAGVRKDNAAAMRWYWRAQALGSTKAQAGLKRLNTATR